MRECLIVFSILIANLLFAQSQSDILTSSKILVDEGELDEAMTMVKKGLEIAPVDHDLIAYQIRILLWQKRFKEAEQRIELLLTYYPDDFEAFQLKTTFYWWQEDWKRLKRASAEALTLYPGDVFFQEKLLIALNKLNLHKDVRHEYEAIEDSNDLIEAVYLDSKLNHHHRIGSNLNYSTFSNAFTPWKIGSIYYHKETTHSWSVSGTYGNMFEENGSMIEGTIYPRITDKLTGYFNASFSNSSVFPRYRIGGELVGTIKKVEITSGARWMNFEDVNGNVLIYTAGLGTYFGSYYGGYKAYLADFQDKTNNITHTIFLRRFFSNQYHYIQINLSEGTIPLQVNNFSEVSRIQASGATVSYHHMIDQKYLANVDLGWQREEYNSGNRDRIDVQVGIARLF